MARKPNEDVDLTLVEELIFGPRLLTLERFSRAEMLGGRTPDFRVKQHQKLVAYCEVKSPRDDWLDQQLDLAPAGQIVGGLRNDPVFNRIGRHVEKAATQFDAVNPDREILNILVFVNHDDASHYGDLHETLTGYLLADDGMRHATMINTARRLLKSVERIDLYVWIDVKTKRIQGYLFNEVDPVRVKAVCALLGLESGNIKH